MRRFLGDWAGPALGFAAVCVLFAAINRVPPAGAEVIRAEVTLPPVDPAHVTEAGDFIGEPVRVSDRSVRRSTQVRSGR